MADPFIGQELGGYRIERLLRRTLMSVIYLARDRRLQRDVVVKIMLPAHSGDESFAARFQQEALATARLTHPNIVHIYDFGQRDDLTYMVMEYLPGGSLQDRLAAAAREGKRLDMGLSAAIVRQIAEALHHAHQAGIVHRDVKPSNILFAGDGRPVLTDLGIAKAREGPQLTRTMTAVGTPEYMSPEQGRGDRVDGRSDIYSLGVVLYELLGGALPFQADTAWGLIYKHMYEAPPPLQGVNPAVTPALRSVVEKALAKRPEDRFQTAHELAEAIQRALEAPGRRLYPTPAPVGRPGAGAGPRPPVPVSDAETRLVDGGATAQRAAPVPVRRKRGKALALRVLGVGGVAAVFAGGLLFRDVLFPPRPATVTPVVRPTQIVVATVPLAPASVPPTAGPSNTVTDPTPSRTATATLAPATETNMPPASTSTVQPTATRLPTRTFTPQPSATPTQPMPTLTQTPTPRPTYTATSAPVAILAPELVSPSQDLTASGQTTFVWNWPGPPLASNQAFEVRMWKEGQSDHDGAAAPVRLTSAVIDVTNVPVVQQGRSGRYFWTVAVVQVGPYRPIGPEAPPRALYVQVSSDCVGPGCDKGR